MLEDKGGLRPCGHRLLPHHFSIIRKVAKKYKIKEGEALRYIIDNTKITSKQHQDER